MREVTWEEFCAMPEGTIFGVCGSFWAGPYRLVSASLQAKYKPSPQIPFATFQEFGPYSPNQDESNPKIDLEVSELSLSTNTRFAVYEPADIDILIGMLGLPPRSILDDALLDQQGTPAYQRGKADGIAEEREACANLCEYRYNENKYSTGKAIAGEIRARSVESTS